MPHFGWLLAIAYTAAAQPLPPFPTNTVVKPKQSISLTLAWDASAGTNVAGYVVYAGLSPGLYNTNFATTNLGFTFSNLAAGLTYFFAVTSQTASGVESDFSNEVAWSITKPASPAVTVRTIEVSAVFQSAPDPIGPWQTEFRFATNHLLADLNRRFYRVKGTIK
jgi:fibronectin type 3 domain-containing protein